MSGQYDKDLTSEAMLAVDQAGLNAQRLYAATGKGGGVTEACKECSNNISHLGDASYGSLPTPGI